MNRTLGQQLHESENCQKRLRAEQTRGSRADIGCCAQQTEPIRKTRLPETNRTGTRNAQHFAEEERDEKQSAEHNAQAQRSYVLSQIGAELTVLRPAFVAIMTQLQSAVYRAMVVQGFWDGEQRNFAAKTALIHSELSEALEANRKAIEHDDKVPQYTGEEAEFADVLIRLLDSADGFNMRLGDAVIDKMRFNLNRSLQHGKAY